jgi:hypothetical protein
MDDEGRLARNWRSLTLEEFRLLEAAFCRALHPFSWEVETLAARLGTPWGRRVVSWFLVSNERPLSSPLDDVVPSPPVVVPVAARGFDDDRRHWPMPIQWHHWLSGHFLWTLFIGGFGQLARSWRSLTFEEFRLLEAAFCRAPHPFSWELETLAARMGMPWGRRVNSWYSGSPSVQLVLAEWLPDCLPAPGSVQPSTSKQAS